MVRWKKFNVNSRCPRVRFIAKQPNIIRSGLIREPSVNTNAISVSPPKRIIRSNTQEKEREKEINELSKKLNNQNWSFY
jgi:hypothetical protein